MRLTDQGLKSQLDGIQVYPDPARLARAAAEHILTTCTAAMQAHSVCSLVLSGGSTPRAVYTLLGQGDFAARMDWTRLHIFWGDERLVPFDHADSNYRMAWEALLSTAPLPVENIHRIHGELEANQAAQEYEQEIQHFLRRGGQVSGERLGFDLLLLGLGEDGHVASLFPGSPASQEQRRWVVAVDHNRPPPPMLPRISLTLPAINSAHQVTFIVSGEGKAGIVQRVLMERSPAEHLPAQMVKPVKGSLLWLLDSSAASKLGDV